MNRRFDFGTAAGVLIHCDADPVYLTNQAPLPGVYSERAGQLYAWMPGVTKPTTTQKDTISRRRSRRISRAGRMRSRRRLRRLSGRSLRHRGEWGRVGPGRALRSQWEGDSG